jgi:hypothetical protein
VTIQDGGCFRHVVLDGNGETGEKTVMLICRMLFLDLIGCPSLVWIHTDAWHKFVPTHTANEGSPLSFCIGWNHQWDVECT